MKKIMSARGMLKRLGLTEHEAQAYLALVELGPALISRIASHAGMHRPTIYQSLRALEMEGLVSVAPKGKQRRYVAEPPEKLLPSFELFEKKFREFLPALQEVYDIKKQKPIVKFFEGKEGLRFIAEDVLHTMKRNGIYYRYTTKRASISARRYLPRNFYPQRDSKQLQHLMITDELADWQKKPDMNRAVKIIPKEYGFIDDNITQLIYGNKVAAGDFETETGFVIESPLFAELQRKIFKALYELL